jgi:hypothetical protein
VLFTFYDVDQLRLQPLRDGKYPLI